MEGNRKKKASQAKIGNSIKAREVRIKYGATL